MTEAEKDKLLATPRPDMLSDAISTLHWARMELINIGLQVKHCETNLDVALRLLQELAARR